PAVIAVGDLELDIGATRLRKPVARLVRELLDDLDAVDLAGELGEDRSLIAETGPYLEHNVVGADVGEVGHQCNDEGLRDGLLEADRKRNVGIGIGLELD